MGTDLWTAFRDGFRQALIPRASLHHAQRFESRRGRQIISVSYGQFQLSLRVQRAQLGVLFCTIEKSSSGCPYPGHIPARRSLLSRLKLFRGVISMGEVMQSLLSSSTWAKDTHEWEPLVLKIELGVLLDCHKSELSMLAVQALERLSDPPK